MNAFSRRDFNRLSAFTAAATLSARAVPALAQQSSDRIGYAIVGLGRISLGHFMPGCLASKHSRVTAFVTGHPEQARQYMARYNVPESSIYTYEQYDRLRDNRDVQAVYIALPNSMHAEYTIRAAQLGKHVLCEKPMATTVADSKTMIAACAAAKKKLMIAYRCQLEPVNLKAVSLIRSGAIGEVQAIESANGFNIQPGEWRLDRKLSGGGPLPDVGIYSLNATRYLTGEEPQALSAFSSVRNHDPRFKEVEENDSWTMRFPSGILASCNTTYGADMNGYYKVHGSKGLIELSPAFSYQGIHMTGFMTDSDGKRQPLDMMEPGSDPAQFLAEADYFSNCILNDTPVKMDGEEGLRDMELIAQIYRSAGIEPPSAPVYPYKPA